jgi:hypothetical protein
VLLTVQLKSVGRWDEKCTWPQMQGYDVSLENMHEHAVVTTPQLGARAISCHRRFFHYGAQSHKRERERSRIHEIFETLKSPREAVRNICQ